MLREEDAIRIDLYECGRTASKVYVFNCRICKTGEIRARANKLSRHGGRCSPCALKERTLRPFEGKYNRLLDSHFRKHNPGIPVTYEEFLKYTKISKCHYCPNPIMWHPTANKNIEGCTNGLNLDRLDCSIGYCSGNMVVCCWPCNFVRQDVVPHEAMLEIGPILARYGVKGRPQGRVGIPHRKLTTGERAAITSNSVNSKNKTGLKGVHWRKSNQKWCSQIRILSKNTSLGCFDTAEDAGRAFDKKAYELYGPAAGLNFPSEYGIAVQ